MLGQKSLISVIIPVYNGERYLGEAIESVIAQTYSSVEIVVVDDGSTDGSAQVAQHYQVCYYFQPHNGPGAARNYGIEQARGVFIAFLDADDLWMPEKLAWQIVAFTIRPELDAVFGQVEQFSSPNAEAGALSIRFVDKKLNGLHAGAILMRRTAFLRVGLFSTKWQVADFFDWYIHFQETELKSITLSEVVMRRRIHNNNLTIRSRETARFEYTQTLKAALDRRRINR